jgi:hypothetical protein
MFISHFQSQDYKVSEFKNIEVYNELILVEKIN